MVLNNKQYWPFESLTLSFISYVVYTRILLSLVNSNPIFPYLPMLAPTKTDLEKTNPMNYNYGMLSQDQYILEREILVIIQKLGKVEKYR